MVRPRLASHRSVTSLDEPENKGNMMQKLLKKLRCNSSVRTSKHYYKFSKKGRAPIRNGSNGDASSCASAIDYIFTYMRMR